MLVGALGVWAQGRPQAPPDPANRARTRPNLPSRAGSAMVRMRTGEHTVQV